MYHGKMKCPSYGLGEIFYTRKDWRHIVEGHSCNPGKQNKKFYNRQLRRGKYGSMELKGSQWKRLHFADLWNWC
jgi:hypothetical protein